MKKPPKPLPHGRVVVGGLLRPKRWTAAWAKRARAAVSAEHEWRRITRGAQRVKTVRVDDLLPLVQVHVDENGHFRNVGASVNLDVVVLRNFGKVHLARRFAARVNKAFERRLRRLARKATR